MQKQELPQDLLEINDLKVRFYTYEGVVKAIEGIHIDLQRGETLGIVGETGCGKSVTALSVLSLVPPPGKIENGQIVYKSEEGDMDLLSLKERDLQDVRGEDISMIFQEPRAYLNPVYTVGDQITEALLHHRAKQMVEIVVEGIDQDLQNGKTGGVKKSFLRFDKFMYRKWLKDPASLTYAFFRKIPVFRRYRNRLKNELREKVVLILKEMRIPDADRVSDMYPHELSGGMAQRVVIATGLVCSPTLLICDEPTTNLDVTVQAQILHLIRELKKEFGSSIAYITHDMGVVAELCDRVAVMYAGSVCELAPVLDIFKKPLHPYTQGLLESIPQPGREFKSIVGSVPSGINLPSGCRFHPRCGKASDVCTKVKPVPVEVEKGHFVECHIYGEAKE